MQTPLEGLADVGPASGHTVLYRRGAILGAKIRGRRFALQTENETIAPHKYLASRLDLEGNDDAYCERAVRVAEGHRRREAARDRGEADEHSLGGAIDRWLRAARGHHRACPLFGLLSVCGAPRRPVPRSYAPGRRAVRALSCALDAHVAGQAIENARVQACPHAGSRVPSESPGVSLIARI